jgi:hypothetical protein
MDRITLWRSISLVLISAWLFITMTIDFIAIPTVFSTVTDIEQAGAVGLKAFSLLNCIELFLGVVLIVLFFLGKRKGKFILTSLGGLLCLASFYSFYLTPELKELTHELRSKSYEEHGEKRYNTLESEHSVYHDLYIKLDGGKILLLFFLLGEGVWILSRREEQL